MVVLSLFVCEKKASLLHEAVERTGNFVCEKRQPTAVLQCIVYVIQCDIMCRAVQARKASGTASYKLKTMDHEFFSPCTFPYGCCNPSEYRQVRYEAEGHTPLLIL